MTSGASATESAPAVLRIVRGYPDDVEIAALVTMLVARSRAARPARTAPTGWASAWQRATSPVAPPARRWGLPGPA